MQPAFTVYRGQRRTLFPAEINSLCQFTVPPNHPQVACVNHTYVATSDRFFNAFYERNEVKRQPATIQFVKGVQNDVQDDVKCDAK